MGEVWVKKVEGRFIDGVWVWGEERVSREDSRGEGGRGGRRGGG